MNRTKRIESKWMNCCEIDGKKMGHISLSHLAIPETIRVTLLSEEIIPVAFDDYGHPIFTEEQYKLYTYKADEFRRRLGENIPVKLEIAYEEDCFNEPREMFDTIDGVRRALASLASFNELLINRKRFRKANPNERLSEFWVFGCFCLDENGQLLAIDKSEKYNIVPCNVVENYVEFCEKHRNFTLTGNNGGFAIPKANSICQCCGKMLTIEDVKHNPCIYDNGKYYHESCYRNYQAYVEVDRFTRRLMSNVYEMFKFTFDLLPNGSCKRKCCSHIPWFMFHTEHGDIKLGRKNDTVFIEWQANFMPFNMADVFEGEDAIMWEKEGSRGIHATGEIKALEYLQRAKKAVSH